MPGLFGMGATIAGVILHGGEATIFNVGNSRVYRSADGFIGQLSIDDLVPDSAGVRKGLISRRSGDPPNVPSIHSG
jgi:serine/threonine protein phosphatase PrpC